MDQGKKEKKMSVSKKEHHALCKIRGVGIRCFFVPRTAREPKGMQGERNMKKPSNCRKKIITLHALEVDSYPNPGWGTTKKM